jgi:hypothetical protein
LFAFLYFFPKNIYIMPYECNKLFKQRCPGYWEGIVEVSKEPLEGLANAKELGWEVLAGLGNYVSGAAGASFSPTCGGGAGLH